MLLFVALVPRFGGGHRICVPLGHRLGVDQLLIPPLRSGVEEVEERRDNIQSDIPVVEVVHLVGIVGAGWRAFF